jgi:hypothetical protein
MPPLTQRLAAKFIRTPRGLEAVGGSAIMAERPAGGSVAIALLANAIPADSVLYTLIATLGAWTHRY